VRRPLAALGLLLALGAVFASAAGAQTPLLTPQDAADLTESLADAQAKQGVCYGYVVTINGTVTDQGSSTGGAGRALDRERCGRGFASLEANLVYTCETCDGEDSALVNIVSSFPDPPTTEDLEGFGLQSGDLLGEQDDTTLFNMVGALPLLVADRGLAQPVGFEAPERVAATDRPTGSPGSDFLRDAWPLLALSAFLVLMGPAYWVYKRRNA
jgi:hypothetical protein